MNARRWVRRAVAWTVGGTIGLLLAQLGYGADTGELKAKLEKMPTVSGRDLMISRLCPIQTPDGREVILTAYHVVTDEDTRPWVPLHPPGLFQFGDQIGSWQFDAADWRRDLASVALDQELPADAFWPLAVTGPKPGDKVWMSGTGMEFAPKAVEARVLRIWGGKLHMSKNGQGGSSGSCVVNEKGEVVGVNFAGYDTASSERGFAELIYGSLFETPEWARDRRAKE